MPLTRLPLNPSYDEACDICDHWQLNDWQPLLDIIIDRHNITVSQVSQNFEGTNPVFELTLNSEQSEEQAYIVKVLAPNWHSQFQSEYHSLKLLNGQDLGIAVPKLLYSGEVDNWYYLIIEKLEGVMLSSVMATLALENKLEIAHALGQFSARLHRLDVAGIPEIKLDWPEFVRLQRKHCYAKRKKQQVPTALLERLTSYLEQHISRLDTFLKSEEMHLIHTDLHPGNLLVAARGGHYRLVGIFDFGDALVCPDPLFEFASPALLFAQGEPGIFNAFLDGYGYREERNNGLQQHMMVLSQLRHTGDLNYLLHHVPHCADETRWQALESKFFPL
ncbi:aminoglycoside phosphotransferase [Shewanella sediminis HAW-EB3]|uniref:Aminoglycoside phosphotransferase n=1 Tax=Shewanella sediminis (strain HAW-EB3) TaxID=425104 RepID=A8G1K9_SHESH|nr:aminoglycoside phosphotransferase family protein [Shewanella sediminis]ABV38982.1 aminoglycoside phosphotransferase [Shewanella sediminis HAW-EB3]